MTGSIDVLTSPATIHPRAAVRVAGLVACALTLACPVARTAMAQTVATPPGSARAVPARPPAAPAETDPALSRSVAARSRMLECGHQWSAMKKAGTAVGTWREFSRGCLAQR